MNSLKVLIIEDDSLLVSQIIATMFESAIADKKIKIVSVPSSDSQKVHRALQYEQNVNLIFIAVSSKNNIKDTVRFVSIARFAHPEPEKIIGIANYADNIKSLMLAGCTNVYNQMNACRYLKETLDFQKEEKLEAVCC
ncbi:MAG: hypothetical protein WCK37_03290 [Candidatus Falkowbacteria bacterium]